MDNNLILKEKMKKNNIKQWELARALLIHESTIIRHLRTPLVEDKYKLYDAAIERIIKHKKLSQ